MPLDFTPDKNSVYFSSLQYYPEYSSVLQQGQSYLHKNPFDATKNARAEQKIQNALKILQDGIVKERAIEKQYTQNIIKGIKDKEIKKIFFEQFDKIFKDDNFDYMNFINLVNSILLGAENYQSILKLEEKRLGDLNTVYKNLIDTTNKTNEEIEDEQKQIRDIYLQRHSLSNSKYSEHFSKIIPTIDYLLAQYITNVSDKIFKDENLREIIKKQIISQQRNDQEVGTYILNNVMVQIDKEIPMIVQAALEDNAVSIENLLNQIEIDEFSHIEINGQKPDFGITEKKTKNITINRKEQDLEKIITTKGNNLAKLLLDVVPKLNRQDKDNPIVNILNKQINVSGKDEQVFTLIEKLQKEISELEKAQKELKKIKTHGDKNNQRQNLETTINNKLDIIPRLKQRISSFVHSEIKSLINAEVTDQAKILAAEKIREILTPAIISITGPQYSELVDTAIQKVGTAIFTGPQNVKADTITIQLSLNNSSKSKKKLQDKNIIKSVDQALKQTQEDFYKNFFKGLPKAGQSTSYAKGRESWQKAVMTQKNSVLDKLEFANKTKSEQTKILRELAQQMKESIVVTETMKTFNQYNNDIGFLSGSLGSNIVAQVGNFAELFEKAGVPMSSSQQEWLVTALINCSPYTIGEYNKGPLEKYLSIMAGFAVFDEGSAEIEIIANKTKRDYLNYSPQIMHLYKLNGMYFPGSYVLSRIYDNLEKEAVEATSEIVNNDGAVISASASEELIGSHKTDEGLARWIRVYEGAKDVTSISVAFISGLFNIVQQLQDAFNLQ